MHGNRYKWNVQDDDNDDDDDDDDDDDNDEDEDDEDETNLSWQTGRGLWALALVSFSSFVLLYFFLLFKYSKYLYLLKMIQNSSSLYS